MTEEEFDNITERNDDRMTRKEWILNSVAFGKIRMRELAVESDFGYRKIQELTKELIRAGNLISHGGRNRGTPRMFLLPASERWRMLSWDGHIKLFIENDTPYLFEPTEILYEFDGFKIWRMFIQQEGEIGVIQTDLSLSEILEHVERIPDLYRYVPSLLFYTKSIMTKRNIENILLSVEINIPIYIFNGERIEPIKTFPKIHPPAAYDLSENTLEVLKYINDHKMLSIKEISEAMQKSLSEIKQRISVLKHRNLIMKVGKKGKNIYFKWMVTEKGKEVLKNRSSQI